MPLKVKITVAWCARWGMPDFDRPDRLTPRIWVWARACDFGKILSKSHLPFRAFWTLGTSGTSPMARNCTPCKSSPFTFNPVDHLPSSFSVSTGFAPFRPLASSLPPYQPLPRPSTGHSSHPGPCGDRTARWNQNPQKDSKCSSPASHTWAPTSHSRPVSLDPIPRRDRQFRSPAPPPHALALARSPSIRSLGHIGIRLKLQIFAPVLTPIN